MCLNALPYLAADYRVIVIAGARFIDLFSDKNAGDSSVPGPSANQSIFSKYKSEKMK